MRKTKLTARQKQALVTHHKIYKTALGLFRKKGFDVVTVDEICRKAGVSKGTFYVYYESKEQVIYDLFLTHDKMYYDFVASELNLIADPMEKLVALGNKALAYTLEWGIDMMQITYRARASFNKHDPTFLSEQRALNKILPGLIMDAQRQGQIRTDLNADDIAKIILWSMDGVIHKWCMVNGSLDLIGESKKIFEVLLKGMQPN
jgi:TetR/AcrR family transcriptional regulator, fatty acid metabolism regulator protein